MKNLFFMMLITLFSVISVQAQSDNSTPQFGVKGGVNFSSFTGDDIGDVDARTSFNLGVLAEIPISDRFSIQPEVLYSGQGFTINQKDHDNVFDTDENTEYQLDYIQVPVLAKIYLVKGLNVEVGPQFGFKVNEEVDSQPTSDGGDINIDSEDSYIKNFDTSLAFGAGYKFDSGFFVSARYTHGLSKIFKDDTILKDLDVKNSVWQFGVGFAF